MYKKVFFKCIFFFFLLFIAGISIVYSLSPSYLFLEKTQTNTSNLDMVLLVTPGENFSSGSALTVSFPLAENGGWCLNDGASLSASGVLTSKIDITGWEIDYPLPGNLTAQCLQGDGINTHDRLVISGLDPLVGGVSYGVKIASSSSFSTGPSGGSKNVIVSLQRGLIVESIAYAIYLQSAGGVTVSGFVNEDFFSTVQVLDPIVERGIWSRVRVRVLDSKGNPIPGRVVQIDIGVGNLSNWEIEVPTGTTNSNGVFQTRVRSFNAGIFNISATDKSFSQDVEIKDSDNLTVTQVPTITLHQLPMYTSGLSRKITWNALNGSYQYFIEASLTPNFQTLAKTSGWISSNEFTFENLESGKAYYYRGKARNIANVESAYSNIVSSIQAEKPDGMIEVLNPIVEKGIWSRVRVTLVDSQGNPLSGRKVVLSIDRSNLTNWEIEQPVGLTNSNGVVEGRIRGFEIGIVKVTAEDRTIPMIFQIDAFDWLQVRELPNITLHNLPNYSRGLSRMINWNFVSGNYQYYIQSSTNSNFTNPRNSGWITANQYLFTNLVHGQGYFYRGKLRNSAQVESSYSNIVSSIQDNENPTIEKVEFNVVSRNDEKSARFTFLIRDLSGVTNVVFQCKSPEDEIYYPCGRISSLNDFHYVTLSQESLETYKTGNGEYFLEYCIRADDIVGNRGTLCRERTFTLEVVEIIEEEIEVVVPVENVVTRVRRNIEDTVVYIQDLGLDDNRFSSASVALVSTLTPATFFSLALNPFSLYPLGQLFLSFIGIFRKKKKVFPYGYVYDAVSKEPINRAIVRIYKNSKLVATTVSNVYGVFTAYLEPGEYFFKVFANDYIYPSKLVTGSVDTPLQNIYRGGKFIVEEEKPLQYSVPLDPISSSRAVYFKTYLANYLSKAFVSLQKVFVVVGVLIAFFLYLRDPVPFNFFILLVYIPLLFIHLFLSYSPQKRSFGVVKDADGKAIQNVIVGLREMEFEKLFAKRVTNSKGRYKFLVPGGKYRLEVLSPEYEIKSPSEKYLYFEGNVKKPLLVKKNLVLKEKEKPSNLQEQSLEN